MHACLLNRFSGRGSHQVGPCAPSAVRRCTHTHTPWRRGHGIGSTAPSSPLLLSFLPPFLFFRSVTCLFSLPFCLIVPACMCAQLISSFSLSAIFLVDFCCRFAGGTLLSRRASQRRQSCAKKTHRYILQFIRFSVIPRTIKTVTQKNNSNACYLTHYCIKKNNSTQQ